MEKAVPEGKSPFATEPIGRLILKFAVPSVIALLVNSLYNIVDQIFIGWGVGYLGNGATNIVFPITIVALALAMMIGNGGAAFLSLKLGEGKVEMARKGVGNAVTLVVIVSVVLAAVFLIFINPILNLFGATDVLRPYALQYGYIIGIGLPFMMISGAINSMVRADGSPKFAMFSMVIGAVLNVILDPVFIFVFHMGVQGAAIATVISQILSAVLVVLSLIRAEGTPFQLFPRSLTIHPQPLRAILQVGVPTALQSVMYSSSNLFIQAAINSFGTDAVAAWTAYGKMDVVFWMTITAMSQSVTTFAGQNYGAGKYDRLKKGVKVSVVMSAIITLSISAIMVLFARPILTIFTPDHDVLEIGVAMVHFLAPSYITYILIELLSGAIRGAGKSLVPTLITVFGVCGLRLLWLFTVVPAHHTIEMVEASYPITWAVTSLALLIYYRFGKWLEPPKAVL